MGNNEKDTEEEGVGERGMAESEGELGQGGAKWMEEAGGEEEEEDAAHSLVCRV